MLFRTVKNQNDPNVLRLPHRKKDIRQNRDSIESVSAAGLGDYSLSVGGILPMAKQHGCAEEVVGIISQKFPVRTFVYRNTAFPGVQFFRDKIFCHRGSFVNKFF